MLSMTKAKKRLLQLFCIVAMFIAFCVTPNALEEKEIHSKKELKTYIQTSVKNGESKILFKYTGKDRDGLSNYIRNNILTYKGLNDELAHYNYNGAFFTTWKYPDYHLVEMKVNYKLTKDQMKYVKKEVKKIAKKTKGKNQVQSVKNVNNYLCKKLSYKKGQNNIYTALKTNQGNCYSYTILNQMILNELKIKSKTEYGKANNQEHIWNKVYVGKKWSYVDVTFNDGSKKNSKYLMVSKKQLQKTHKIINRK